MPHISRLLPYTLQKCMIVDQVTCANLELLETMYTRSRKGSLLGHLDHTVTPMGARKLKNWLLYPLLDIATIEQRLDLVELFVKYGAIREHLREILQPIRDLERLNSKISSGLITPYDLGLLCTSLEAIPLLIEILDQIDPDDSSRLTYLRQQMYPLPEVVNDIRSCLKDELPNTLKDGEFIREGYHPQLDEYRDIAAHGKDRILEMEYRERERTGIQSLHIKFNKVFGYFIEVTKANLHRVPTDFLRKQTMVNCERYITEELKEFEEKILEAQDKILSLEQQLFDALRQRIALHSSKITEVADAIAQLDVLTNFSHHAVIRNYCRPQLTDNRDLRVVGGRHPVVEATMSSGEFVPNDLCISSDNVHFILITGPNMSGKSTVMRQIALIALLAQIGAFVPAQEATIGICDRIFTRVGATDNLAGGQSTFMVEMTETSNILHNATSRSLVILDEIGRGTSTFDGISIAWSVAEYLHDRIDCRTLFATHYHELTELGSMLTRLRNMNVAINEWQGEIRFLHKLIDGSSNRSYGIQVARLAGLPRVVVRRAHRILLQLEQGKLPSASEMGGLSGGQQKQLSLFIPVSSQTTSSPIEEELRKLDLDALSPIEALRILHRWQHDWCKDDADAKSNLE
jgi:DNA mismatch repair protein MutS